MKNKVIICSIVLLALFACDKKPFSVDVEMTNANGKVIYLQKIIDNQMVNIDSTLIEQNKAHFDVKKNKDKDAYHIFIKGWKRSLPFFADNEDVIINGDFNNYNKIKVVASKTQEMLNDFNSMFFSVNDDEQKKLLLKTIEDQRKSALSPYILYRYKWICDLDEIRDLVNGFPSNLNSGYLGKLNEYISLLERTEIGRPFIDFTMNNIDGQAVSLSDIVKNNKLTMVDFWAAWCPDCRVENPNVVAVYNDFKDKGLEIISVSLDTDKEAWLKGIKDDALSWENHVSELDGWNCSAASEYGVAWIPQNVLIDNNGKIVAKNLSGNDLRIFVENYLK